MLTKLEPPNTIHIAFGIDQNYAKYMGVSINSIIFHHIGQPLHFHIFYDEITQSDKLKLELIKKLYKNVKIKYYDLSTYNQFNHCHTYGHITKAAYYRLIMPDLLSDEITKIIYLDSDTLCIGNLNDLWHIDLKSQVLAAYKDPTSGNTWENLSLSTDSYFNSGVLLINIKQWKSQNFTKKIFECIDTHPKALDQDILNILIDGNYLELPQKFNHMLFDAEMLQKFIDNHYLPIGFKNFPASDTVLIHFATSTKPWHKFYSDTPHKKLYWTYVKRSLWFDMEEEEPFNVTTILIMIKVLKEQQHYQEALHYAEILIAHLNK